MNEGGPGLNRRGWFRKENHTFLGRIPYLDEEVGKRGPLPEMFFKYANHGGLNERRVNRDK